MISRINTAMFCDISGKGDVLILVIKIVGEMLLTGNDSNMRNFITEFMEWIRLNLEIFFMDLVIFFILV